MSQTLLPQRVAPLDGGRLGRPRPLHRHLSVTLAFVGYPLLWFLGLNVVAFGLAGLVGLWQLGQRRGPWHPRPVAVTVWIAFIAWTLTAIVVLGPLDRVLAFLYRETMYVAATALLLVITGTRSRDLADRRILRTVSVLWFATVAGGLVALITPGLELTTITERLLPGRLLEIGLVRNIVHLQVAAEARFLGFPIGRPEAPFPFTNAWGSNLTLLMPVVLATWSLGASRRWRITTAVLVVLSVVPLVISLNRGAWLTLAVVLLYVGARRVTEVSVRRTIGALVLLTALAITVLVSPLGTLVSERLDGPGHSDEGRLSLYTQAIDLTQASPLVGYGAPQPNQEDPDDSSIGTHGQLWLLLVSHGVPAALLYVGFFAWAWYAAVRWRARHAVWLEATLVAGAVQFPIYELLPAQTITLCVVAAVALRGYADQQAREAAR